VADTPIGRGMLVPLSVGCEPPQHRRLTLAWARLTSGISRWLASSKKLGRTPITPRPKRSRSALTAFAAGIVATLCCQGLNSPQPKANRAVPEVSRIATHSLTDHRVTPTSAVAIVSDDAPLKGGLLAVLAIDRISPLGRDSIGMTREDALTLAEHFLHQASGLQHDRQEAAYWLKHALRWALPDQSLTWALTQLGSVLAMAESGAADYGKARAVWQVAASLGDPVATCFLARTYEFGLGAEKNLNVARRLYGHAMTLGGCPGLEATINHLR
jgi:hypothetical protein